MEETNITDQSENVTQAHYRAFEDVALDDEHHTEPDLHSKPPANPTADGNKQQEETEIARRSQQTGRLRERFTYNTLGQPSHQQLNAGVNSLLPIYPLQGIPSTLPLPYYTDPHPYLDNCYTQPQ